MNGISALVEETPQSSLPTVIMADTVRRANCKAGTGPHELLTLLEPCSGASSLHNWEKQMFGVSASGLWNFWCCGLNGVTGTKIMKHSLDSV